MRNINIHQCCDTKLPIAYIPLLHNYSLLTFIWKFLPEKHCEINEEREKTQRERIVCTVVAASQRCYSVLISSCWVPPLITQLDIQSGMVQVAMSMCETDRQSARCLGEDSITHSVVSKKQTHKNKEKSVTSDLATWISIIERCFVVNILKPSIYCNADYQPHRSKLSELFKALKGKGSVGPILYRDPNTRNLYSTVL